MGFERNFCRFWWFFQTIIHFQKPDYWKTRSNTNTWKTFLKELTYDDELFCARNGGCQNEILRIKFDLLMWSLARLKLYMKLLTAASLMTTWTWMLLMAEAYSYYSWTWPEEENMELYLRDAVVEHWLTLEVETCLRKMTPNDHDLIQTSWKIFHKVAMKIIELLFSKLTKK